jgi:hypothetical protein
MDKTKIDVKLTRDPVKDGSRYFVYDGELWQVENVTPGADDGPEGKYDIFREHEHDGRVDSLAEAKEHIAMGARAKVTG